MAHPFVVLEHPSATNHANRYTVLRDGFALLALIFPLPWLLFYRLWLEALLLLGTYVALGALASGGEPLWLTLLYVFNSVAAFWVALDGRHWIIERHLRRGATLKTVVDADSRDEAELRFALTAENTGIKQSPAKMPVLEVRQKTGDMLFATPWGNS